MDKIKSLYELYLSEGLITEETSLETFSKASEDQIKQLYDLGSTKELFTEVDADTFATAWGVKKKDGSELPSEGGSLDSQTTNQPGAVVTPVAEDKTLQSIEDRLGDVKEARQEATKDTFLAGMATFNNILASIPAGIQDLGGFLTTPISMLLGKEAASSEGMKDFLGVDKTLSDYYKEEQKRYQGEAKEATKTFMQDHEAGIVESLEKGNYSDALDKTFFAGLESAPVSLAMMSGGSVATLPQLAGASTLAFFEPSLDELREQKPEASNTENVLGAITMAGAESVFSSINAKAMSSVYKSIIKKEGLEAGAQVFKNTLLERLTAAMAKYGAPVGALSEGLEEVATQATQNAVKGRPIFEGAGDAFIVGMAMGGVMSSPINAAKAVELVDGAIETEAQKKISTDIIESSKYKDVLDAFSEKNTKKLDEDQLDFIGLSKSESILKKEIKEKLKDGDITKEEADQYIERFNEASSIRAQFEGLELSVTQQSEISALIKEKRALEKKIKGKDGNLVKKDTQRLSDINNQIESISEETSSKYFIGARELTREGFLNRISDMSQQTFLTSEVRVENDKETSDLVESTFMEASPETYVDVLEKTKKENPSQYWSVSEVDLDTAKKGEVINTKDGSALVKEDGDIVGLFKKLTSKAKGVALDLLEKAVEKGGVKLDNFDGYLTKQYEKAGFRVVGRTPFNEEFAPEDWTEDKGKPDVVAMVYDPSGSLNIEEKSFEDYEEMIAYRDSYLKDTRTEKEKYTDIVSGGPKFQKEQGTDVDETEVNDIVIEMNKTEEEKASFDVPSDLTTKEKTNIQSLIKRFGEKVKTIKDIASLEGIPFIFTISDQLTSGDVNNPFTGETINLKGGIGFNMTEGNEANAWANTTEAEANNMLGRAQEVYNKNKPLFERLWSEGKIPNGHVPMAVVKMGQTSIKSNEAVFRFASNTFKNKFSKAKRVAAKDGLLKDLRNAKGISQEVIDYVAKQNTIDEVLDNIKDLNISKRPDVTRFVFTGDIKLGAQTKPGKPKSNTGEALVGNNPEFYKYVHLQTINNILSDPATSNIPDSHVVSVVGVDVLNPQVTQVDHQNYPYGVKGQLIGILEKPVHAADVFPEMYSKSFYLQKENKAGKPTSPETAVRQSVAAGGAIAGIKAFRGAKMSTKMDTMKKLLGKLKLAFPSVTIVETQQEFDRALEQPNVFKFVKKGEVVYGFTMDGKVFLNPSQATANTAIHEFGHVWINFLKQSNPDLLKKGYDLLEGTDILRRKIVKYGDVELAREEAIAELMGNKGETIVEAGFKSKFKNWLNAVFTYVKNNTKGFADMSSEEFTDMSLENFIDGSLNSILQGKEITAKEIKSVGVRFQKEGIKGLIRRGLDEKISEKTIKEVLEEQGYSKKEVTSTFLNVKKERADEIRKAEGIIDPMDSKWSTGIQKYLKKLFKARKLNAKSSQIANETREGAIESQVKQAMFYTQRLKSAIKSYDGKLGKQKLVEEVNKIINGEPYINRPEDASLQKVFGIASVARNHIDLLSEALIESGAIKYDESIKNIEDNKGKYLTTAYRMFDSKNWEKELLGREDGKQIIARAKNFFLKDQKTRRKAKRLSKKTGDDFDTVLDLLAERNVDLILQMSEKSDFIKPSKTGKKDVSILKEKKEIPEVIRMLMGEYTDPIQNYQRTVYKISNLLESQKYLEKVREAGLGVWLFEKNDLSRPKGYDQVISVDSDGFGPLAGLYTSKEIKESMENTPVIAGKLLDSKSYRWYLDKVSKVKYAKTIWSPATHGKNVFGNMFFMGQNLYINPEEYYNASKLIVSDLFNKSSEEQLATMRTYIEAGIINQNATLRDLQDVFKESKNFEDTLDKAWEKTNDIGRISKAKIAVTKGFKTADKFTRDIYQAEDDLFKIIAFETERKRQSKIEFDKKYSELSSDQKSTIDKISAENTKNLLPNYGRVGEVTKYLRALPVLGSFASFQLESYRTAYNTVNIAMNDLKSDNPRRRVNGAKRLAAIVSFQTIYHVGVAMIGQSFGGLFGDEEDDQVQKYLKPILPEWNKNSKLLVTDIAKGFVTYTDMSGSNPHGQLDKVINAMFSDEDTTSKIIDVLNEAGGSLLSEDILYSQVKAILLNEDRYGRKLRTAETSKGEDVMSAVKALWKAFEPGGVRTAEKLYDSYENNEEFKKELIAQFTGFRTYKADYAMQSSFAMSNIQTETRDLKKYARAKRQFEEGEISVDELNKVFSKYQSDKINIYKPLINLYKGALFSGVDHYDMIRSMKKSGIPTYIIEQVVEGKIKYVQR